MKRIGACRIGHAGLVKEGLNKGAGGGRNDRNYTSIEIHNYRYVCKDYLVSANP